MKCSIMGMALAVICSGTAIAGMQGGQGMQHGQGMQGQGTMQGQGMQRGQGMQGQGTQQGQGAQGQGPGPQAGNFPAFNNIDTNGDGYLTQAEIQTHQEQLRTRQQFMQELADEAAKSPNGRITAAEFAALEQQQIQSQPQPQQPQQQPQQQPPQPQQPSQSP